MSAPLSTRCSKHPMLSRELNVPRRQDDKRAVFRGELRALGGTPAMRLGSGEDGPEGRGHQQMPDREKGLAASPRPLQPRSQPWPPIRGGEPAERGGQENRRQCRSFPSLQHPGSRGPFRATEIPPCLTGACVTHAGPAHTHTHTLAADLGVPEPVPPFWRG